MLCVLPYISGDPPSNVSLRLIDWFVTNYAKKHNVMLVHEHGSNHTVVHFNVYLNYRSQLKAYSKQQFDPFRRRDRIMFHYSPDAEGVETTVGQLNFFRWMLQSGLLEYVNRHAVDIERDMIGGQQKAACGVKETGEATQSGGKAQAHVQVHTKAQTKAQMQTQVQMQTQMQDQAQMQMQMQSMTRVPGAMTVAFE